jgi:hypothetical protein
MFPMPPFLDSIALANWAIVAFFSLNKKKTLKPLSMSSSENLFYTTSYAILPTDFDHIV